MKKILMTVAFAALAIAGANAQTKFGVRAGLNLADVAIKSRDVKAETKIRPSFYAGALAEFAFNDVVLMDAGWMQVLPTPIKDLKQNKEMELIYNIHSIFLYGLSMILRASVLKQAFMQVISLALKQKEKMVRQPL